MDGLRLTLRQSLSMLAYLTLPASVGLMLLGVPIIRLIYQHGRFTADDTLPTATALFLYSFGLVGYTGVKILAPAFYALGRSRLPLAGSLLAVGSNLLIVWLGYPRFGFRAIAAGTAVGSLLNAAFLIAAFEGLVGGLRGHGLFRPIARMVAAALAMGGVAWVLAHGLELRLGTRGLVTRLATCLLPIGAGVAVYWLATRALQVGESREIGRLLLARLRPCAPRAAE
jgi:putative peptidoglycan lipid II flippase